VPRGDEQGPESPGPERDREEMKDQQAGKPERIQRCCVAGERERRRDHQRSQRPQDGKAPLPSRCGYEEGEPVKPQQGAYGGAGSQEGAEIGRDEEDGVTPEDHRLEPQSEYRGYGRDGCRQDDRRVRRGNNGMATEKQGKYHQARREQRCGIGYDLGESIQDR
jgi:hypothetical protein